MDEARSGEDLFGSIRRKLNAGFHDAGMMERAVHAVHAAFQAQFQSQGAYGGSAWAQLAESTIRSKPGRSYQILVDSGDLQRSLTEPGAPYSVVEFVEGIESGLRIGTDLEYAGFHQTGTPNMPARELATEQMWEQEGENIADAIGRIILGEVEV